MEINSYIEFIDLFIWHKPIKMLLQEYNLLVNGTPELLLLSLFKACMATINREIKVLLKFLIVLFQKKIKKITKYKFIIRLMV